MTYPGQRYRLRRTLMAALLATSGAALSAPTTWDPAHPAEVRIGSLVLDDTQYTSVVVTVGDLLGFSATGPHRTYDSYNPANGQVTIATLTVGNQSFYDVVISVAGLVSVGGVVCIGRTHPQ